MSGPIQFLGLDVIEFNSSVNIDSENAMCSVQIVKDAGQTFQAVNPGDIVSFQASGYRFDGMVQAVQSGLSMQGKDMYTIALMGPNSLLQDVSVVVDQYNGGFNGIPNAINAYGFLENTYGYGASLTNAAGMPWYANINSMYASLSGLSTSTGGYTGLLVALDKLINLQANNVYGSGIYINNQYVQVDFDGIQTALNVPTYYRVPGPVGNLLEIITNLFKDGGKDFIPYFVLGSGTTPTKVYFKTIDRSTIPADNQLPAFIASQPSGTVISWTAGHELRNETTNYVLIGAPQQQLVTVSSNGSNILPYFGDDTAGNPIIGAGSGSSFNVTLNGAPIADVLGYLGAGTLTYNVTDLEMRAALGGDYDAWAAYMVVNKPAIASDLLIAGTVSSDLSDIVPSINDFIADDEYTANIVSSGLSSSVVNLGGKLFEFVKQTAQQYYGKQFLVSIPGIENLKLVPNTNEVTYSIQPCDAGLVPNGESPLGLAYLNQLGFMDTNGLFRGFSQHTLNSTDLSMIDSEAVVQDNPVGSNDFTTLYSPAQFDPQIVHNSTIGYAAKMMLSQAIVTEPDSSLGSMTDIASLLGTDVPTIESALEYYSDSFPIRVLPALQMPAAVALPLRSNVSTYGPYYTTGVQGKTSVEINSQIAPWNFNNDYSMMDAYANALLQNAVTHVQKVEAGSVEVAGYPTFSLGDPLVSGGSEITSINFSFGMGGIKTTYTLATYTPQLGKFSRQKAETLAQVGQTLTQLNRALREVEKAKKGRNGIFSAYQQGQQLYRLGRSINQQSPHSVLLGVALPNPNPKGSGVISYVSMQKAADSVANAKVSNQQIFSNTAVMSMEGVFRPFSTSKNPSGSYIAHFYNSDPRLPTTVITGSSLNPLASGNDIGWVSWGSQYGNGCRFNARKASGNKYDDMRGVGLKGPPVIVGPGYDIFGRPFPNATGAFMTGVSPQAIPYSGLSDKFYPNYLQRQDLWTAAPEDLRLDQYRGLWVSPGFMIEVLTTGMIPAKSTGSGILLIDGTQTKDVIPLRNPFSTAISGNKIGTASYLPYSNKWAIHAVDC